MRDTTTAYLLSLLTFFGFAGIHRFYLGKPITGVIWFLTWGLGGFGTLYDMLTMARQVDEANARLLPPAIRLQMLAAATSPPPPRGPREDELDLELRVLRLAKRSGGRLTAAATAAELRIKIAEAEAQLDALAKTGHANVEVNDDGVIYYDFPSLRV
ncbi:MAG: TM2 domain-containing protein [Myxococcales bacterium]|nr:TM2 domain-containing protein [Myxococcales bacterium]